MTHSEQPLAGITLDTKGGDVELAILVPPSHTELAHDCGCGRGHDLVIQMNARDAGTLSVALYRQFMTAMRHTQQVN